MNDEMILRDEIHKKHIIFLILIKKI